MPWTATIGDAMAGLTALLVDAGVPGVTRGPQVTSSSRGEVVTIGFQDDAAGQPAAEGTFLLDGAALTPSRERFSIHCAASVLRGDTDTTAAQARALELLAAVGAAVAGDTTLGGAVMVAELGGWSLWLANTQRGAFASVRFTVDCDAYTRR